MTESVEVIPRTYPPLPPPTQKPTGFMSELTTLINKYSVDSYTNMPDYVVAQAITRELDKLHEINALRDSYANQKISD